MNFKNNQVVLLLAAFLVGMFFQNILKGCHIVEGQTAEMRHLGKPPDDYWQTMHASMGDWAPRRFTPDKTATTLPPCVISGHDMHGYYVAGGSGRYACMGWEDVAAGHAAAQFPAYPRIGGSREFDRTKRKVVPIKLSMDIEKTDEWCIKNDPTNTKQCSPWTPGEKTHTEWNWWCSVFPQSKLCKEGKPGYWYNRKHNKHWADTKIKIPPKMAAAVDE